MGGGATASAIEFIDMPSPMSSLGSRLASLCSSSKVKNGAICWKAGGRREFSGVGGNAFRLGGEVAGKLQGKLILLWPGQAICKSAKGAAAITFDVSEEVVMR